MNTETIDLSKTKAAIEKVIANPKLLEGINSEALKFIRDINLDLSKEEGYHVLGKLFGAGMILKKTEPDTSLTIEAC